MSGKLEDCHTFATARTMLSTEASCESLMRFAGSSDAVAKEIDYS
jgi:hypothetical protein